MPRVEDAAARRRRHTDTAISALIAGLVIIALALVGVRDLRLSAAALLAFGASIAVSSAWRANWDWTLGGRLLLLYVATTAVLWVIARAFGLE